MHDVPPTRQESSPTRPLLSTFAGDPEMEELVSMFVNELPDRVAAIRSTFDTADFSSLRRLAHQLKGASAGYGFAPVGEAAGDLEAALTNLPHSTTEPELKQITRLVNELTDLCQRVRAN